MKQEGEKIKVKSQRSTLVKYAIYANSVTLLGVTDSNMISEGG